METCFCKLGTIQRPQTWRAATLAQEKLHPKGLGVQNHPSGLLCDNRNRVICHFLLVIGLICLTNLNMVKNDCPNTVFARIDNFQNLMNYRYIYIYTYILLIYIFAARVTALQSAPSLIEFYYYWEIRQFTTLSLCDWLFSHFLMVIRY